MADNNDNLKFGSAQSAGVSQEPQVSDNEELSVTEIVAALSEESPIQNAQQVFAKWYRFRDQLLESGVESGVYAGQLLDELMYEIQIAIGYVEEEKS